MAFSAKCWADIRAWFESGQFRNVAEIQEKCKKRYGKTPIERSIYAHSEKEGWKKGSLKPEIEKKAQGYTIELFAKYGITSESIAQKLQQGINLPEESMKTIINQVQKISEEGPGPDNMKMLLDMVRNYLSDHRTALEYMKEYHKIVGSYAPIKREHTGKDGGPIQVVHRFAKMSDDELNSKIKLAMKKYASRCGTAA